MMSEITEERLELLLDAYGAEPARWPDREQEQVKKTNFALLVRTSNQLDAEQQKKLRTYRRARRPGPPGGPPGDPPGEPPGPPP